MLVWAQAIPWGFIAGTATASKSSELNLLDPGWPREVTHDGVRLSSVSGSSAAEDTVLLARVPTRAVINRGEAEAQAKVEYDSHPQFAPIEGTSLSCATNTSSVVIKIEDKYYLCASPSAIYEMADQTA